MDQLKKKPMMVQLNGLKDKNNILLDNPHIESYQVTLSCALDANEQRLEIYQQWVSNLLTEISKTLSYDGIILGHIKGNLVTKSSIIHYSITEVGIVKSRKIEILNNPSTIARKEDLFKFDILTYIKPSINYYNFLHEKKTEYNFTRL